MRKRAAVWGAVSSRPQAEKISIDEQLKRGRDAAAKMGWDVVCELVIPGETRGYVELSEAIIGLDADLPEGAPNAYRQLAELLEARAIDVLICTRRNRLGRKDSLVSVIEEKARMNGCQVYSLAMPGTGVIESDLFLAAIERATVQTEVVVINRNQSFGIDGRIIKGQVYASHVQFPYVAEWVPGLKGPIRTAKLDLVAAEVYRWAVRGTLDGSLSQDEIAARLTVLYPFRAWYKTAVRVLYLNPLHVGLVVRSRIPRDGETGPVIELQPVDLDRWPEIKSVLARRTPAGRVTVVALGQHEAVISPDEWLALQDLLERRRWARGPDAGYLWSGILKCAKCGAAMNGIYSNSSRRAKDGRSGRYHYYVCQTRRQHGRAKCCNATVRIERVTPQVVGVLGDLLAKDVEEIEQALYGDVSQESGSLASLRVLYNGISERLKRLGDVYEAGLMPLAEYAERRRVIDAEAARLRSELAEAEAEANRVKDRPARIDLLGRLLPNLAERLERLPPVQANRELRVIFRAIWLEDGEVVKIELQE